MSNQATRLAGEARRLATVMINYALQDLNYLPAVKPLMKASKLRDAKQLIDSIDALLALVQPAVSEEAERERFELVTSERLDGLLDYSRDPDCPDRYDDSSTDFAWEGWQAARAQSSSKGDEGMQHE